MVRECVCAYWRDKGHAETQCALWSTEMRLLHYILALMFSYYRQTRNINHLNWLKSMFLTCDILKGTVIQTKHHLQQTLNMLL